MRVRFSPVETPVSGGLAEAQERGFLTDFAAFDALVDSRAYHVLRSRDNIGIQHVPDWRWHFSVSGHDDVPCWRDLVAIAHEVRPAVCFVVGVPPRSWWLNVHPHRLHLYESRDINLMAQWKAEAQGHAPS